MWLIKKEHPLDEEGLILLEVEIHSPCCRGKIFKYYLKKSTGEIFNHQLIEIGSGARAAIQMARDEYRAKQKQGAGT